MQVTQDTAKARASLCKDGVHITDVFWDLLREKAVGPECPHP